MSQPFGVRAGGGRVPAGVNAGREEAFRPLPWAGQARHDDAGRARGEFRNRGETRQRAIDQRLVRDDDVMAVDLARSRKPCAEMGDAFRRAQREMTADAAGLPTRAPQQSGDEFRCDAATASEGRRSVMIEKGGDAGDVGLQGVRHAGSHKE